MVAFKKLVISLGRMILLAYTMSIMPGDAKSPITLKLLLYSFEMMMSLKINFHKSCVYNLSSFEEVGTKATFILNYSIGFLPFNYLELPIKVTSLTREDWQPLIERVEKRLATWKDNALSRGLPLEK